MIKIKYLTIIGALVGVTALLSGCVVPVAPGPIPGRQCWRTVGPQGYVHWHCNGYQTRRCRVNNWGREVCNYV